MTLHQQKPKLIDQGIAGELANLSRLTESADFPHTPGKATQSFDVTVDTATGSTTYEYTVNGETISYTSPSGTPTKATIAAGLVAAHNDNIVARGMAKATDDGVDTVTLTASFANEDVLDVSEDDANLSLTESAEGGWVEIPFGRAIVVDSNGQANLPAGGASAGDFEGIALRQLDEVSTDLNSPSNSYTSPRPVVALLTGDIYVEDEDGASKGDAVWIGTDSGEKGKFFTADNTGNTRVQITDGSFAWKREGVIRVKKGL